MKEATRTGETLSPGSKDMPDTCNKAEYQITAFENEGIFEVAVTGNATYSAFEKMINEVNAILKANNAKKAVFDIRALEGRIEYTEIYRFVRNHPPNIYEIECIIVDLPENSHYKTATRNAGLSLKWFTDMDSARDYFRASKKKAAAQIFTWLISDTESRISNNNSQF
jgi:hypothetical protein